MNDLTDEVNRTVLRGFAEFCADRPSDVALAMLTGSFARGLHDRGDPNVNVYLFAQPERSRQLRLALAASLVKMARDLARRNVVFRVDCHPYLVTLTRSLPGQIGSITLTTKVLEAELAASRFSLPPTIGHSWRADCRPLFGDASLLDSLAQAPAEPAEWIASSHEALARYRGILDHLPFVAEGDFLARESVFYAREALRDLVAIASPFEALNRAEHLVWLNQKREHEVFERLDWLDVIAVSGAVGHRNAALKNGTPFDQREAEAVWMLANDTWSIVWEKYLARARDTVGATMPWLLRVNAFV